MYAWLPLGRRFGPLIRLIAVSLWAKRSVTVKLSALLKSSLNCGENGDEGLRLEEMLWLCDFCVTGMEAPFRIHLGIHLGPSCRQFPNQLPV